MGETADDVFIYSADAVTVFGILGNILVVISILRQKNVLKNNYYFLVLQLAICDLGVLVIYLFRDINRFWLEEPLSDSFNKFYCLGWGVIYILRAAGVGMMLIISVLRYRATVHPLKPAITRRKLKVICGLVYVVGLIAVYGPFVSGCGFVNLNDVMGKIIYGDMLFCCLFFPTVFMAVVYFKIGRALIKQNKYIKSVCSNPVRRSAPSSSFNIMRFIRDRKTFFVCLITVLCYAVGSIPLVAVDFTVFIAEEYSLLNNSIWFYYLVKVLGVAGCHSVNPLIYGILDKKLFKFWKLCRKTKRGSQKK